MTTQQKSSIISTSSFATLQPIRYLNTLQKIQLSGQLLFAEPKGQQWIFHLDRGKLIYATGGSDPLRRWQRILAMHCPQIIANSLAIKRDLASISFTSFWDYQLLELWVKGEKITQKQATNTILAAIEEVLFDVGQTNNVTHQLKPTRLRCNQQMVIDLEKAIANVNELWQAWHNARLGNYSPNQAPTIKQPNELKQHTSLEVYETLTKFLDGKQSLRDLAVQKKWDLVEIGSFLLPYLESGLVEMRNIPDLPIPVSPTKPATSDPMVSLRDARGTPVGRIVPSVPAKPLTNSSKALIACVDDSQWVTQMMERLITTAGYRFIAIDNSIRAVPILLGKKPDLIFLDLVMPNVNGYELCTQLRKLSSFKDTPIVILTGNDGATERIRSKFVGASDFLSKPLNAAQLLKVIRKYTSG